MKHICKILLVMCCVCLCSFSGCDEKNDLYEKLDTKKAEQVALEYMIEKYGEGFSVVSSKKEYEAGYVPASIQSYWCDVELTLKDSETMDNYIVRVTLKDNGEKPDYVIEWDNYMNTLVAPLIKRDIESAISKLGLSDYSVYIYSICEEHIGGKGFSPDFNIDPEKDTLNSIIERYDLWVCLNVNIPESTYKENLASEFQKILEEHCSQKFSGDYIRTSIISFDDAEYPAVKKINDGEGDILCNNVPKEIHYDDITLG